MIFSQSPPTTLSVSFPTSVDAEDKTSPFQGLKPTTGLLLRRVSEDGGGDGEDGEYEDDEDEEDEEEQQQQNRQGQSSTPLVEPPGWTKSTQTAGGAEYVTMAKNYY